MTEPVIAPAKLPRPVGRPRRLSLEDVLDAGVSIGLENLTMAAVAERLGVRVTVLYNYVANRDELVRLASARVAHRHPFPIDRGQSWAVYVCEHALALFELLTGPGDILTSFMAGGQGPEVEIDRAELCVGVLRDRGIHPRDGLLLQRKLNEIVIGGAVNALHIRALETKGADYPALARMAVKARSDNEIPLLKQVAAVFAEKPLLWKQNLVCLLHAAAAARGEQLDEAALFNALSDEQ